jgi:hypothetical protein
VAGVAWAWASLWLLRAFPTLPCGLGDGLVTGAVSGARACRFCVSHNLLPEVFLRGEMTICDDFSRYSIPSVHRGECRRQLRQFFQSLSNRRGLIRRRLQAGGAPPLVRATRGEVLPYQPRERQFGVSLRASVNAKGWGRAFTATAFAIDGTCSRLAFSASYWLSKLVTARDWHSFGLVSALVDSML